MSFQRAVLQPAQRGESISLYSSLCVTLGHFPFVQIMSREQTVAMETVVSDAVGKATPTNVQEWTKLNILRGSQSTQATTGTHAHSLRLKKS